MDATQELGEVVGRDVYSNNGVFVGTVEDVRLDLDAELTTGLAVGGLNRDLLGDWLGNARGVIVPYRWVRSIGDVVLVSDVVERLNEREATEQEEATA